MSSIKFLSLFPDAPAAPTNPPAQNPTEGDAEGLFVLSLVGIMHAAVRCSKQSDKTTNIFHQRPAISLTLCDVKVASYLQGMPYCAGSVFDTIRNNRALLMMARAVRGNPSLLVSYMQQIGQQNPELLDVRSALCFIPECYVSEVIA